MGQPINAELLAHAIDVHGQVLAAIDPDTGEVAISQAIDIERYHGAGHFLAEMYGRGYSMLVLPPSIAAASEARHARAVQREEPTETCRP